MNTTKFDGPTDVVNMRMELGQYIDLITAVAETIRKAEEIPSGMLYAAVMDVLDLRTYNNIIGILKRTKLVREQSFLLIWIGPRD